MSENSWNKILSKCTFSSWKSFACVKSFKSNFQLSKQTSLYPDFNSTNTCIGCTCLDVLLNSTKLADVHRLWLTVIWASLKPGGFPEKLLDRLREKYCIGLHQTLRQCSVLTCIEHTSWLHVEWQSLVLMNIVTHEFPECNKVNKVIG